MGPLRRLILRQVVLPLNYLQRLRGFILQVDDKDAGYIFLRPRSTSLQVETIAVEPEYRRQGYAGQLLAHAIRLAKDDNLDYLTARLTPQNAPAASFFQKQGFRPYRELGLRFCGMHASSIDESSASIEEHAPTSFKPAYERWMQHEVEQGDGWAKELLLDEYRYMSLVTAARHWRCLLDGEEVGYLRISGLTRRFTAYLACDRSTWNGAAQAAWLAQAVASYPSAPGEILLDLASGGHLQAGRALWESLGFESFPRPRYLIFKSLKGSNKS